MRILAIDTSCGAASAAMVESGEFEPLTVVSRMMARGMPKPWRRWSRRRR